MPIATINGININYQTVGQGEPLVMVMGFASDQNNWRFQVPLFKKHYHVVTFDNRGVGKSDKPAGPYTTRMMAEDAIGLMDHLGIKKAHILGVSMGGMIAQEIAINHPERVLKLVLGCTYACNDGGLSGATPEATPAIELALQGKTGPLVLLIFNKSLFKLIFLPVMKVRSIFTGRSTLAGHKAQWAACKSHQALDRLSRIQSPTLVIVGTKDRLCKPTSSEVIAAGIPGARLVKIEGGSHTFSAEMRRLFNKEVLDFLKNS